MSESSSSSIEPTKEAVKRLKREYREICASPPDHIIATPNPENLLEWHYVLLGPEGTPYENGMYHGRLVFKPNYPHAPPAIYMITPNGRFDVNNKKLCTSFSDYHAETWSPAWSVSSMLVGLLSFMLESEITAGAIQTTDKEKRRLAAESVEFNQKNLLFREMFPYLVEDDEEEEEGGEKIEDP